MRRYLASGVGLSLVLASLLATLVAAPVAATPQVATGDDGPSLDAVVTGTNCGQVTAFVEPTAVTDGSITLDGVAETIAAGATLDAATTLALSSLSTAEAFTCLDLTVDADGDITAITVAGSATICGTVSTDGTIYTVGDTTLAGDVADLLAADGDLTALLDAVIDASADVCLDVAVDAGSGVVTAVDVDASFELCGTVASLDADSAAVAGLDIPFTALSAAAEAALTLALEAGAEACVDLVVEDTAITSATVSVTADVCGTVTVDADGNATVNGVEIPAELLNAGVSAVLVFAADADGLACADVTVTNDTVAASANAEVCATVTVDADGDLLVGGAPVPAGAISAELQAALELAAEAGVEACVTIAADSAGDLDATVTLDLCATVDAVSATSITVDGVVIPLASGASVDVEVGAEFGLRLEVTEDGVATAVNVTVEGCDDASGGPGGGDDPSPTPDENVGGVEGVPDPDATLPPTSTASERASSLIGSAPAIALTVLVLLSAGLVGLRLALVRRWH
jgi:biopolymer transport protein ExbD